MTQQERSIYSTRYYRYSGTISEDQCCNMCMVLRLQYYIISAEWACMLAACIMPDDGQQI